MKKKTGLKGTSRKGKKSKQIHRRGEIGERPDSTGASRKGKSSGK